MGRLMALTWQMRSILGLAAILAPMLSINLAQPTSAETHASLAGQLLVATPSMGDPRFDHAVILMVRHDKDGALGILINRPLGTRPLAKLLEVLGENDSKLPGEVRIFAGGPVQPELGFIIHSADYHRPETLDIAGRVAMTSSRENFRDIAADH